MKRFSPYCWFALFALCSLAYTFVQDDLRPNYHGDDALIIYLLGVAPNFFPAMGLPALFVILLPQLKPGNNPWFHGKRQYTANAISLLGLLLWEFAQTAFVKARFDWHDVLWTCIGALVFHAVWRMTPARLR
jgi:hypothetical protein